ncbi:ABC transporter permease [Sandaracinus amylolyticus]|uniref:ABC transporter permease n=1 Tax=Sandaracinus amylolyticus TaxID=927083 RepID=UPI001F2105DA|nr:ABC transporter permease [Sandaracinus amylolyticus]
MRALDRKLFRDLTHLRGQVITIALVVAAGIASWVSLRSTYSSLLSTRDAYYSEERFGDVFAHLERAPRAVASQLEQIDGVAEVYPRLVEQVLLPVDFLAEPAIADVVSLPEHGEPPMNALRVLEGRLPDPARTDEVVLLEAFASKHGVRPGDVLPAVLEGRRRELCVVGIAMSPEYVFATTEGAIAAEDRFAVLWMPQRAIEPPFRMEGAFDDVVIRLQPGASVDGVIAAVDRVLAPYGARRVVGRRLQASNYYLDGELSQLESFATVAPMIFLGVAAFLLNVVLARLVHLQRGEIAVLKAVGYASWQVGLHFLELVAVMVVLGALIGVAAGAWLGDALTGLYTELFRFPFRAYRLGLDVVAVGVVISLGAALVGALGTVRQVVALPPAEAMRPPAPASYRATWLSRGALARFFETSGRMVLREIERRPLRLVLSSLGIAMAIAIVVVGRFSGDAMEHLIELQFQTAWREDVSVDFTRPLPERAVRELAHLPGVERAEGTRLLAARLRAGHRWRDAVVVGHHDDHELRVLLDQEGHEVRVPEGGVVLTRKLAEILDVRAGETVTIEALEGERRAREVRVAALIDEPYGLWGHMSDAALHEMLGEQPRVSQVVLRVDPYQLDALRARVRELPHVLAITRRQALIDHFREQSGRSMSAMTLILTTFAIIIAVGVVYNNARVALSVRARDLASLRVLGFTRGEISAVLLGELGVQILLAIPFGLWFGTLLAHGIMATTDPERYRLEPTIAPSTYAFAALVAIAAGLASALLVRRRLDRLDLIAVLKTRE